jgi:hypothetical protein
MSAVANAGNITLRVREIFFGRVASSHEMWPGATRVLCAELPYSSPFLAFAVAVRKLSGGGEDALKAVLNCENLRENPGGRIRSGHLVGE